MAWNEPGGDKNDPWKNRGGKEQGPPDIDDVLKNLFGKFGKGGDGNGKSKGPSISGKGISIIAIVLVLVYLLFGFYTVKEAERGVVLRFGEFQELANPGLNWRILFVDEVTPVNVQQVNTLSSSGSMLTEDDNVVTVEMEVQYRIDDPQQWLYSVINPQNSLSQAFDSAIRYVIGHSRMEDVLTSGRQGVRDRVFEELNGIIEPYKIGVTIVDLNFTNSRPPEQVREAFEDAIAAQEDKERYIREAEAYAREIEPAARAQVNRLNEEAQAYKERKILQAQGEVVRFEELLPQFEAAPEVTRQRIYLETLESVYSNTTKVMIDTEGSGNMMYLPLDKIMSQQQSGIDPSVARRTLEALRNQSNNNNVQVPPQPSSRNSTRARRN